MLYNTSVYRETIAHWPNMNSFGEILCWDNANSHGTCSSSSPLIPSSGEASSYVILTIFLVYVTLVVTNSLQRFINVVSNGSYGKLLSPYLTKELFWAHGAATFSVMYLVQPTNLTSMGRYFGARMARLIMAKYMLLSMLIALLWDGLYFRKMDLKGLVLLNCHHIGLFLAIGLGRGWALGDEDSMSDPVLQKQVSIDTCLFGWMWAIHGFGFILKHIFPLFGIHLLEGERSVVLDRIKYVYSTVTFYWYYKFFKAESQPGVGFNYQTLALLTMLVGRFIPNTQVPFLRRVEMPGVVMLLFDGILFDDIYMHRSAALCLAIFVGYLIHFCCFKRHDPKPTQFFSPKENARLRAFLEAETNSVNEVVEDDVLKTAIMVSWFESEPTKKGNDRKDGVDCPTFPMRYPLHYAVCKNDKEQIRTLLESCQVDVNEPIMEHCEVTPLQLASFCVRHFGYGEGAMLILLKNGANPYLVKFASQLDTVDDYRGKTLGGSENFFERYNDICLERSPPNVVFSKLTLAEKLRLVPI